MDPNKIPSGFVTAEQLETEWPNHEKEVKHLDTLDAKLHTDRSGANLVEIEVNGTKYFLSIRTD